MAKATLPMLFLVLLLQSFIFGATMQLVNGQVPPIAYPHVFQNTWCVAKPSTRDADLQNNVEYACKFVDCSIIQPGGECFYPDMLISHASVAMNLYYATMGRQEHNCDFSNSALISDTDPSYDECSFA